MAVNNNDEVWLWNIQDGKPIVHLNGLTLPISFIHFSPDGSRILTGNDIQIQLWSTQNGSLVKKFEGGIPYLSRLYNFIGPDGTHFVTLEDGQVQLRKIQDGEPAGTLEGLADQGTLIFSPDGGRMVTIGDGLVRLWNGENGQLIEKYEYEIYESVRGDIFSPKGTHFVTTVGRTIGVDDRVQVWNAQNGMLVATLEGLTLTGVSPSKVLSDWIWFNPDERRLMTISADDPAGRGGPGAVLLMAGLFIGLFRGLGHKINKTKTVPNQGIWLSARNAVLVGLLGGLGIANFLIIAFFEERGTLFEWLSLYIFEVGSFMVSLVFLFALWYGGFDAMQHITLRLILYFGGYTPRNYAHFGLNGGRDISALLKN